MRGKATAIFVLALVGSCSFGGLARAQSAARAVLESAEISGDGPSAVLTVGFALPVRYVRHFPESRGNELRIMLEPSGVVTKSDEARFREAVKPAGFDDRMPVDDVAFERDDTGAAVLTVRFSRTVSFRASQGRDPRTVRIELPGPSRIVPASGGAAGNAAPTVAVGGARGGFVVNLASSDRALAIPAATSDATFASKTLYTTTLTRDGRAWHRLRLGFFATAPEAELAAARLHATYPQAWVDTAAANEGAAPTTPPAASTPSPPAAAAGVVGALTAAREAMDAGSYDQAIQLYSGVLDGPPSAATREAREMLGVAWERNGQPAHAKSEYERYLTEYPDGDDSARVRQRLNSLIGRGSKPKDKLRDVARNEEGWRFDEWGSFSSYYRRDERYADEQGDATTQSLADTNLDLGLSASRGEDDLRLAFNGGYTLDFLESDDSETDINELYVQYARSQSWISARAGRQSRSKGGVLGRFDGMLFGYKPVGWANVNVTAGFPVKTWEDSVSVDDERRFAGVSVDLGPFDENWDFNLFFIDQEIADVIDRRAVGGEARYLDRQRSVFALLDYDVFYDVLNTAYVIGSTALPYDLRADASIRYGTTPILTTSNALIGQPFDSMDELLDVFSKGEVYDLARDRTADGVTFTASATRDLTERFQLSGDFAYSTVSSTDTSGGVDEIPDTGNEFFYGLQLIGSSVLTDGDVSVASLRYSDGASSDVLSLDLNTRVPVRTSWWIGPRVIFDYEPSGNSIDRDLRVRPRVRVEYRWLKHHRLELEGGGQWIREGTGSSAENVYGYTAEFGYRFDF